MQVTSTIGMPTKTAHNAAPTMKDTKNITPAAVRPWQNCPRPGTKNDIIAASMFSTPGFFRGLLAGVRGREVSMTIGSSLSVGITNPLTAFRLKSN